MYFGNTQGILEYDGNSWRLIKTPNNSIVRSLSVAANGKIYVAGSSDFGYLEPDSKGLLQFVSLLEFLEEKYQEFGDVWDVASASHGAYFKTRDKIFRWHNNKITVIDSVNSFRLYNIDEDIFVRNQGTGLIKISGDSLLLIPDGERFANMGVYDMLPFGSRILITTSYDGLFLYDGKSFSQFETEADEFFSQNRIYNACILEDGNIAIATMRGGAVIINKDGHLSRIIDSKSGLNSDIIYDIFPDQQGGLWVTMAEGIARFDPLPAFVVLSKESTGNKSISSLYRFRNTLYSSTAIGLFYLDELNSVFNSIEGPNAGGQSYISIDDELFTSSITAIYRIDENNTAQELLNFEVPVLYQSEIDTNIIYVMYRVGLAVLRYNNGKLELVKDSAPVSDEIADLAEDGDGSLWIKTYYEGLVYLKDYLTNTLTPNVTESEKIRYNKDNGLPGTEYSIIKLNGKVLFATDAGLFRFDKLSNRFIPDSTLGKSFTDSSHFINSFSNDRDGNIWLLVKTKNGQELGKAVKQTTGNYLWKPDTAFRKLDLSIFYTMYADYDPILQKDFLFISTDEGLIKYDPSVKKNYNQQFSTLIRRVTINVDSVVYNGTSRDASSEHISLAYNNSIRFNFSSVSFIKPGSSLYQYYLEGSEENWSVWTSQDVKEYTNLSSGDYKFRVRSKNIYGTIGGEDVYAFTVLSPWYFSWWSYFLYGLLFLFILYIIRLFELKRLQNKHALQLELVEYGKLKELDQLKSQFFANISHEFRTPLTLILGQIDSVMSSAIAVKEKGKLQVANRNARRLLTLINQLLDLSKLEAGSMELNAEQHNLVSFVKSLFFSFESQAEAEKITLKFETDYQNIPVIFDPDKMEKVFYNLISNAFKFTSENGEIKVIMKILISSEVEIQIKDTGLGIPADRLPHIFDRFYQVDSSMTRKHEGTGIGLALTKELVALHKGKITVHSKENEGSVFILKLPLGDFKNEKEKLVDFSLNESSRESIANKINVNNPESVKINQQQSPLDITGSNLQEIILIVEDNSDVRSYIREQLENDYKVFEAADGEQGISTAQNEIPDLIVTDVMMPEMNGFQFSKLIRSDEKTSHIPIIMLTAKAGLDDKIEGLETGIDAYITKPFNAKELKVRVKNLIQQRKQLRKRFSTSTIIKPSEVSAVSADQTFLNKTVNYIETHFEDENLSSESLANEVNMSVSQLNRKLNALVNQPAGQLIRSFRLQRAADLLKQNAGTVAEICYKVGFNDQAYFSRAFKKQFGHSPSDHKKNNNSPF